LLKDKKTKEEFVNFVETVFVPETIARNYTPETKQVEDGNLVYVRTQNGVKLEVKLRLNDFYYVAGYGNSDEEKDLIKQKCDQKGWRYNPKNKLIYIPYIDMETFFKILDEVENITEIVRSQRGTSIKLFEIKYNPYTIANKYFQAIKDKDQASLNNFRAMLNADDYDKFIAINKPSDIRTYREHPTPCVKLHNEICERIYYKGATRDEIALLIKEYLKLAYISPEDASYIDYDLGWKTVMPEGWNWGDSVTARLDEAKVSY